MKARRKQNRVKETRDAFINGRHDQLLNESGTPLSNTDTNPVWNTI